jgi:cytochrome c556
MQPIVRRALLALAAALVLTACTMMSDMPPANPQAVVDERVTIMKGFVGALAATTNYTQGKATAAAARTKLTAARANMGRIGDLFPRGTALGDRGVTHSRALSTIFTNRSDFADKLEALAAALATLDEPLTRDAKAQTMTALAAVKTACTSCHDKYRAPED